MTHCPGGPVPQKTIGWLWGFLFGLLFCMVTIFVHYLFDVVCI